MNCRVRIGRNWYDGEIRKLSPQGSHLVRYIVNGKKTVGRFTDDQISIEMDPHYGKEHLYRKTENVKIQCKCGYKTVIEKRPVFGKCPECMAEKWTELEDMGRW